MSGYGYYPGYWGNGAANDTSWMTNQVMGDPALGKKDGGIGISSCNTRGPTYPKAMPQVMVPPANGQMWPMENPAVMAGPQVPMMAGPQVPMMGAPQVPMMAGPQVPMMAGPQVPMMAGPQVPMMAGPQVPMNPNPVSGYVTVPSQGMTSTDGVSYPPRPAKFNGGKSMPCPPAEMAQPITISPGELMQAAREARFPSEVVKAGDVVDVRFRYWPELDYAQTVRPDGRITLQLVNDVHVAGMTPSNASHYLEELYADKLKDPEISLYIRYTADQRVYVGGEVRNPGLYRVEGKKTVLQAVMEAGGFINESADQTKVVVLRDHCGTRYGVIKNLREILRNSPNKPLYIKGDDVVFVTRLKIDEINQNIRQYINNMMPRVPFQWVRADGDITWGWPGGF